MSQQWVSDPLRRGEPRQLGTDNGDKSILIIWPDGKECIKTLLDLLNSQPKLLEACEAALFHFKLCPRSAVATEDLLQAAIAAAKGQE